MIVKQNKLKILVAATVSLIISNQAIALGGSGAFGASSSGITPQHIEMNPDSLAAKTSKIKSKIHLKKAELELLKLEASISELKGAPSSFGGGNQMGQMDMEALLSLRGKPPAANLGEPPRVEVNLKPAVKEADEEKIVDDKIDLLSISGLGETLRAKILINGAVRTVKAGSKISYIKITSVKTEGIWIRRNGVREYIGFDSKVQGGDSSGSLNGSMGLVGMPG